MTEDIVVDIKNANIYQNKVLVLHDVNLTVKKGDFIYLIGRTGSGKSSLLKTLYGEVELREGEGTVTDYDLRKLKRKDLPYLRRKLGIVFQDFQLLMDRSVYDNLEFVLKATGWKDKAQIEQKINDTLALVDLKTKHFKYPHQLSGGEQQRVAVGRSLLNHPQLILADEPTGNLDPRTSDDIMQLLFTVHRETQTPIFMATHNYNLIEKFPAEIYKCVEGKILKEEDLMLF
ncbi:MAG: ATP-binding cassette domain-containing protein [Chitinophagales bacterium]|nr:ATP-binding cassette domain-containing protein [Chitinophagales bacterium]